MAILDSSTIAAEATPPRGQPSETHEALEQALMQAGDHEWPSQPFSSLQQHNPDGYAVPATRRGRSLEMVEQSPQHAVAKISLLTRPTSSGEDLAAGFSFGRAPPMQLDFTRKKTSIPTEPASSEDQRKCHQVETQTIHQESPPIRRRKATKTPANAPSDLPTVAEQITLPLKLSSVPFPSVGANASPKHNHPSPQTPSEPRPSVTALAQREASMSADDTLVGSNSDRTKTTRTYDNSSLGLTKSVDKSPVSCHAPNMFVVNGHHQQDSVVKPTGKASREGAEANDRPTVTKTRRKKQSSVPNRGPSHSHNSPTEEDLLNVLLYKRKQAAQEREKIQESQQAKDAELQRSIQIINELYAQLQDVSQRYSEKEAELARIKACKPGWESKLKKLSDYVKGLTNDHNRLRDDAKLIREQQTSVLKDKNDLFGTLREVYQASQKENARSNQVVTEARHDLEMLEQTMQHQQLKIREEEALLVSERLRSSHLEEEISAFTTSGAELQESLAQHREAITEKINDLLTTTSQHVQATPAEASQDDLRPMLEQCITLIEALPKPDVGVKPADFQQLEDSVRIITRCVEACNYSTSTMESGHQQLALLVQKELQALSSSVATKHTLSEEIMDLREMRATVRERLHSTETALRDSRLQVVALQQKEAEHQKRITAQENDWRGRKPIEDSQTSSRLQETDSLNKDLRRDLATSNAEVNSMGEQLQQREEELRLLQIQFAETQALLEEARQQKTLVQSEKLDVENKAVIEREEMRSRLSKAASLELANLKSRHLDLMQQSKAKDSPMEEKYRETANQLIIVEEEKGRIEKEATTTKGALETLQKERQNEATSVDRLRLRIAELEKEAQEKGASHKNLQQKLQDEIADNQAKDGYLKAVLAHQEEKKKAERCPSARGSEFSVTFPPQNLTVVGDSQPAGYPRFASHIDIMGLGDSGFEAVGTPDENLFEASQAPEDLDGLFPDTPKQLRTVEVTNVSYSRSRVSSREGAETPNGKRVRSGTVRQPLQQTGIRPKESFNADRNTNTTSRRPHLNPSASKAASIKSPPKSGQPQRATQETSNAPRGILKQATQDPRGQKRPAADSEVPSAAGFTATKRRKSSAPTNGLGPVIADSQSPANGVGGRGRKQTTRHGTKTKKDDRFLQTFKGYTNNGHLNGSQGAMV